MTYSSIILFEIFCLIVLTYSKISRDFNGDNVNQTIHEGCGECAYYRCPESSTKCLLGSVPDPCECCPAGRCAKFGGEPCWNSSIIKLSKNNKKLGFCATNYACQLRNDLLDEDEPEAICTCIEQSPACGSNGETYDTPCALHEDSMRIKNSTLKLKHLGPCPSRPWITSPLENVIAMMGQRVALNCEAKGSPLPNISWLFHSSDASKVFKLPNDEHESTIHTSDGPENLMRTSWLHFPKLKKQHLGHYQCIANNTIGETISMAFISLS